MKKLLCFLTAAVLLCAASCADKPEPLVVSSIPSGTASETKPTPTAGPNGLTYDYAAFINGDDAVIPLTAPDQCLYYRDTRILGDVGLDWAYDEIAYVATHFANENVRYPNVCDVYFSKEISEDDLARVYDAFTADHPELWFLRQPDKGGCTRDPQNSKVAYLTFSHPIDEIPALDKQVQTEIDKLTDQVSRFTSDVDKMAYLSGYLFDHTSVDWPAYGDTNHSSIMELLVEKHGVCIGYASTTTHMFQHWGIPAISGFGKMATGMQHCFTIIKKDGVYACVDNYYMRDKGSGVEHGAHEFFCFTELETLTKMQVTVNHDIPMPGSPVGAGIVIDDTTYPTPEPTATPEATPTPEA